MPSSQPPNGSAPSLKRVLGLPALILYGIILIQPTAPMPLFGAAAVKAQGHVVTIILIGMVAMLFTAVGYGRMPMPIPAPVPLTPTSAAKSILPPATSSAGA